MCFFLPSNYVNHLILNPITFYLFTIYFPINNNNNNNQKYKLCPFKKVGALKNNKKTKTFTKWFHKKKTVEFMKCKYFIYFIYF